MKTIKRFYQRAEPVAAEGGYVLHLDSKAVKTPGGRLLCLPTLTLAEAVTAEWQAQEELVLPASMPLTQLASTALDRVGPERAHMESELLNYAGTDLLCYRVDHPADLAERQAKAWQPLLDWAALALDAPLLTTTGLVAVAQPPEALAALARQLAAMDDWRLTALQSATTAMGSLILGFALVAGRIDAGQAFDLSQLDETYQIEQWGEDYEAADRRASLAADMAAAARFRDLLNPT